MSRVVTAAVFGDAAPHVLAAASRDQYDPVTRELLADAAAEAYERGRRAGHDEGVATSISHHEGVAAAVSSAAVDAARMVRAASDDVVEHVIELAFAMAAAILAREPHDGGAWVAEQVRGVLAQIEDPAPIVHVHPDDVPLLSSLIDMRSVTVEADSSLTPGEARVRGGWADAELTRATAFAAIRRELDVAD